MIEYGHVETHPARARRLQGSRRGRRHRRAAGGRQRGRRRAGPVRSDDHPAAADPGAIVALIDARRAGGRMKPAPFDYHAPAGRAEAVVACSPSSATARRLIAGGQSLVPLLAAAARGRSTTSSTSAGSPELRGIEERAGRRVDRRGHDRRPTIGRSPLIAAAVPLLARATPLIGHFQIRNRGTIGGSLAHADPAGRVPGGRAGPRRRPARRCSPRGPRAIPAARVLHRHLDHRA